MSFLYISIWNLQRECNIMYVTQIHYLKIGLLLSKCNHKRLDINLYFNFEMCQ